MFGIPPKDQVLRLKLVEFAVQPPKPSTVSKPEQRELNGLKLCEDFANSKTLVTCWES